MRQMNAEENTSFRCTSVLPAEILVQNNRVLRSIYQKSGIDLICFVSKLVTGECSRVNRHSPPTPARTPARSFCYGTIA